MNIEIRGVSRHFGGVTALRGVDLRVAQGEMVVLLGPSGCGKTTLLRVVAGLEAADNGAVLFTRQGQGGAQEAVSEPRVGFLFQQYALFPHLTLRENVAFGHTLRKNRKAWRGDVRKRVDELLRIVGLEPLAEQYPHQLSGGQSQRAALARTLAVEPDVLLLDEPFSALDAKVRKELRGWLRYLQKQLGITSIFVTHDQGEALELADRIVLMRHGAIEQVGEARELWDNPVSPFVFDFLGGGCRFHGFLKNGVMRLGDYNLPVPEYAGEEEQEAIALIRSHHLTIGRENGGGIPANYLRAGYINGTLHAVFALPDAHGGSGIVEISAEEEYLRTLALGEGATVFLQPKKACIFLKAGQ
ncbi:MAG: sulfate/molybdate ABC transporter ATP-binding protein [Desulfovibrio sp.]|jgi:sulfate transport system ATP-binding protein|nr:sulfate/molybdate ABC transporter ATP-binding protein [Desulfovibrio sp.]